MQHATKRTIGNTVYEVRPLPTTTGYRVLMRLIKLFAPSAAAGVGSVLPEKDGESSSVLDANIDLVRMVERLVDRLDDAVVDETIQALANHTAIKDGDKRYELVDRFEVQFSGKMGELIEWLMFALEVNYSDFLSVFSGKARGIMAAMMAASPCPNTSCGPSGAS